MSLGTSSKRNFRMNSISFKIRELVSSAKYVPSLFILLETKLKCFHKKISLPKSTKYLGETSGIAAKAGIFLFTDRTILVENFKTDVCVISSTHAMYVKVKHNAITYEVICVYLPCETQKCLKVLDDIDEFIVKKGISSFTFIGDMNISFEKIEHRTKARRLISLLEKCKLFDLAKSLNMETDFTWRGRGLRSSSMSKIDHCFTNTNLFNNIQFNFNSFSDHKTISVGIKNKFNYCPPKWKNFLFKNSDFIELMKNETISFLFDNADSNSITKDFDLYLQDYKGADDDLLFSKPKYNDLSVIFALLKHLKQHHDKFYSRMRLKTFHKTQHFDKQISQLYKELDKSNDVTKVDEIKFLFDQQQEYFKNLSFVRAETSYMRGLILDGHSNAYTFMHSRQKFIHENSLLINGEVTSSLPEIVNHLSESHAKIVSPSSLPISNLDNLLNEYDLSLEEIYTQIPTLSSPNCSTKEYKDVIKSMSNNSCPGISSEPKILFQFLFDFFPKFSTRAFNHIFKIDIDKSPFACLKDRNIIFIPKKGSDPKIAENLRPIALMENMLKISSKALNKKVTPHLSKIIHSDQHGFTPGRHMHTASVSIIATMNHIRSHNLDSQFISFDIKRAFDRVIPEVLHRIIKYIFPNGNFAQAWINLTSKGRFRAIAGNCVSNFINILLGTSQGGPSASTKYNILHHIFICCLNSRVFNSISLNIRNMPLPAGAFADDSWKFYCFKTYADVEKVHRMLSKLETSTGLKINFAKTKILVNGSNHPNLEMIGNVYPHLKHLGIYLSFDMNIGARLTYDELLSKLDARAKRIPLRSSYNIFKRRNLCMSLLNSKCFHIFRVYSPNGENNKKIWKIMSKFLWSSKTNEGISYRYKVSQKRIELDFSQGGLKVMKPEQQSLSIFIASLMHVLNHGRLYPDSTLGILLSYKHVDLKFLLNNFGCTTFQNNKRCIKSLYPEFNENYFHKIFDFLKCLEKDKATLLQTPIVSSSWFKKQFNKSEADTLHKNSLVTFASLLDQRVVGDRIMLMPILRPDIASILPSNNLVTKLKAYVKEFSKQYNFPSLVTIKRVQINKLAIPLINTTRFNPSVYALHFKRIHRDKFTKDAPSIKTRANDGLYFPDVESFQISFKKLFDLPLVLYFKSFFFEQFIRTLSSKRKLSYFGYFDTSKCSRCKVESSTEHALMECFFPKYFIHALAIFLDQYYLNGNPEFIFMKENFFLFNMYFEQFTLDEYNQISTLILAAKDRSLKISKDECLERWTNYNCLSQSLFIAQYSIKLLNSLSLNDNVIVKFQEFLLKYRDNVNFFDR